MHRRIIITIDGPAGSGKSTLGRHLARTLNYRYLDSGALYRAVAWQALQAGVQPADRAAVSRLLKEFHPCMAADAEGFHLTVNGRELTWELRTPEVSEAASQVAAQPAVRAWVGQILRELAAQGGVVAEGRDLGTVVFPEAPVKFYLDAELSIRAARRQKEWQDQGVKAELPATLTELARRDERDQMRELAPLAKAPEAHYLDTTRLSPEEVASRCLRLIQQFFAAQTSNHNSH